jgi:hypothetical protein
MSGHHLWNFIRTAWEMLRNALSTSNLSLAVFSLCVPLAAFVVAVIVKWYQIRSLAGLALALKASTKPVLIVAAVTIAAWFCLFSWAIYKSVYNDHQNLSGRMRAIVNEKDALKATLKERDYYIKRLEQAGPQVITRTLPVPEPEKKCWFYNVEIKSGNKIVQDEMQTFVYCNKRIQAPYLVKVTFNTSFQYADADVAGAGTVAFGNGRKEGNTVIDSVQFPSLPAYTPVIVRSAGKGINAIDAMLVPE